MSDEKLVITLSPASVFHLNAYLSGLKINQVKSSEQLSAIAETLDNLSALIEKSLELEEKQLKDAKKK